MRNCLSALWVALVAGVLGISTSAGASIVTYAFPDTTAASFSPSSTAANVTGSPITGSPNVNNQPTSVLSIATGVDYANQPFLAVARANTNESGNRADVYFRFTVTAEAGNHLDLTSLTFDVSQGGGTAGTRDYEVRSSVDNFADSLTGASPVLIPTVRPNVTPVSADLSAAEFQGLQSITFEIRFFTPGVLQNVDFDNITVNGTVVPEPAASSMLLLTALPLLKRRTRKTSNAV